jgi:TetR/AcrR family transcriptional regulator, transcriptional repressor of aconitase
VAELLRRSGTPVDDPDGLARVLIAIYQGLQLQTAWDETVDNGSYVAAVAALLDGLTG